MSTTSPVDIHRTYKFTVDEASSTYKCTGDDDKGSIAGSICTDGNRSSNTVPTNKPLRDG